MRLSISKKHQDQSSCDTFKGVDRKTSSGAMLKYNFSGVLPKRKLQRYNVMLDKLTRFIYRVSKHLTYGALCLCLSGGLVNAATDDGGFWTVPQEYRELMDVPQDFQEQYSQGLARFCERLWRLYSVPTPAMTYKQAREDLKLARRFVVRCQEIKDEQSQKACEKLVELLAKHQELQKQINEWQEGRPIYILDHPLVRQQWEIRKKIARMSWEQHVAECGKDCKTLLPSILRQKFKKCGYCGEDPADDNGNVKQCSRCKKTLYCGVECQRAHRQVHKEDYCCDPEQGLFVRELPKPRCDNPKCRSKKPRNGNRWQFCKCGEYRYCCSACLKLKALAKKTGHNKHKCKNWAHIKQCNA